MVHSQKCISKYRLLNGGHFAQGKMSLESTVRLQISSVVFLSIVKKMNSGQNVCFTNF